MRLLVLLTDYLGSLGARIALILTVGMSVASIGSLLLVEAERERTFLQFRADSVAISATDLVKRLKQNPAQTERWLRTGLIFAAHYVPDSVAKPVTGDALLQRALDKRLGFGSGVLGNSTSLETCFGRFEGRFAAVAAGQGYIPLAPECWTVRLPRPGGDYIWVAFDLPPMRLPPSILLNPLFSGLIVLGCAILSVLVSRFAMAPLRRLTVAARAFSRSMDAEPIPEKGPTDVRAALVAFNTMQRAVREGVRERTRILAAISHDLQTPLTRMRLRLENNIDNQRREKLVADLRVMQTLVREGLDLARSSESAEGWSVVHVDSLLSSIADDWQEMGAKVQFISGCGARARVKPDALMRCVTNLIDNALKYGGGAEICASRSGANVVIKVHDDGPGIAEDQIAKMFEPFVRGEQSRSRATGGTGIGLTIARAQANTFGGQLHLSNRPGGGLAATLSLPA